MFSPFLGFEAFVSSFRFSEERLSAPFFFQIFCKEFAIPLGMSG